MKGRQTTRISARGTVHALALFALALARPCFGEIKVVSNLALPIVEVSAEDLRSVFLGEKTSFQDGFRVRPVLEKNGTGHEEFVRQYLGKTDRALQTYYRSLVFTGKASMPITFASDAEVLTYVAKTPGAIGYVNADTPSAGVKTLRIR